MQLGAFNISIVCDGTFWLDGGAMFGVVPKVIWDKLNPADKLNRIKLKLNCLLVETSGKNVLIDTGIGDKLTDRFIEIYRIERDNGLVVSLERTGLKPEDIDFVINTHLHFDHCGGNTRIKEGTALPTFPNAKYIIQRQEWKDAIHTNERTKASYIVNNFKPIEESDQLTLADGEYEVCPGIKVILTNGHTRGHQSVLIESEGKKAFFLGDLIPTTSHIKIPYIMGYDLYPTEIIETKKRILSQAFREHWLLVFEHDPKTMFAYLVEENGKMVVKSEALNTKPKIISKY